MKKYLIAILGIIFNVALLTGLIIYAFATKENEGYIQKEYIIIHEEEQETEEQETEEQEDSKKIDNNINNTTVKKDYQNNTTNNTTVKKDYQNNNTQNICTICMERQANTGDIYCSYCRETLNKRALLGE